MLEDQSRRLIAAGGSLPPAIGDLPEKLAITPASSSPPRAASTAYAIVKLVPRPADALRRRLSRRVGSDHRSALDSSRPV